MKLKPMIRIKISYSKHKKVTTPFLNILRIIVRAKLAVRFQFRETLSS